MSRHTCVALTLVGAMVTATSPSLAGDFSEPVAITTWEPERPLQLVDAAALGDTVVGAVAGDFGAERLVIRAYSETDGETWSDMPLEMSVAPRYDVCDDSIDETFGAWVHPATGNRRVFLGIGLESRQLGAVGSSNTRPDVACVPGKRAVVVHLWNSPGVTWLRLVAYPFTFINPFLFTLGRANKGSTPAVAAVGDRIYVAWTDGTKLRFKRFVVGGAPGYPVTAKPTVTIEDATVQGMPRLAAHGSRVVLAWERKGNVVARVSTDKGRSFGARKALFTGDPPTGKVAFLTDADALGSTIVVSGAVVSEGISVVSGVKRSENDGASWSTVPGSQKTDGFVAVALGGTPAATRLHLLWDERFLGDLVQSVRAQYIDLD